MTPLPHRSHADDLLSFIRASPSPYHAVASAAQRLEKAGFRELHGTADWTGTTGGSFVARDGALIAWYVPEGAPAHTPFRIVGTHTDSPNLRVKPTPDTGSAGWRQVAVEVYGGVPLNTWLDRDLGISGRLALRGPGGGVGSRLVQIDEPLLRVPQLAIHLDRTVNEGLALDRQRHLAPLWALGAPEEGALLRRVAEAAEVERADVLGWDLMLHDIQPPGYLGADREFVVSARLDNLVSVHAGVTALAGAATAAQEPSYVPVLAAFDHEEVGSGSHTGAQSPLLERVLGRSVTARGGSPEDWSRALSGSFCVSADMAHAVHPNYAERHDPGHHPLPNGGATVKVNVNQRYATDSTGMAVFAAACERAAAPWQPFVSNNAMPCGTSIGPLTAARLGVPTVDVGVPGLSMHSARELCGAADPGHLAAVLGAFVTSG
ncbi:MULTISPECIES: M18 family aminopeptidase [unclassified Streptomyces]|uniref:M18 family aminopeptidase n=1 Tax=unclassified Streptomyces TaxID=2593676 RepID=UPI00224F9A0F|nr:MULTISPECIES: M18 family aminopeptidase [unclassified Streptomyces]WSU22032.1 M18 family aminopeptidase [Streptomyces sp. NBC_01108]MCX4789065.1 M18 family aminopeptidase [Streptomyces sp. NBC_01221]MCX4795189.1 M18 family aminopeptidase [Streptomyces sp. NBC_01242]WSJ36505.1 M18 family aminopeptidase [Streptomyces sp. NBC_01321]WSP62923.1 M18 family aminopeptidase [Streptomyces sp. NBC_01240]